MSLSEYEERILAELEADLTASDTRPAADRCARWFVLLGVAVCIVLLAAGVTLIINPVWFTKMLGYLMAVGSVSWLLRADWSVFRSRRRRDE